MPSAPHHRYLVWLLIDATLAVIVGYEALREALFWHYGTTEVGRWLLANALIGIVLTGSNRALMALDPPEEARRLSWPAASLRDFLVVLIVFQLIPILMVSTIGDGQGKGLGLLYVVSDWHQIAREFRSFVIEAPLGAGLMGLLFTSLLYLGLVRQRRWLSLGLMVMIWAGFVGRTRAVMVEDPALFIILFVPATLCAALAMALKRPKFAARSLAWGSVATFVGLVYLGDLPLGKRDAWRDIRGVTQLYPCDESPLHYPIRFARDIRVDTASERIFLAYGPSSGIMAFDLHTGCHVDEFEARGMIRSLWTDQSSPYLYGADDVSADVYQLHKRPLRVAKEVDLFAHDGINDGLTLTVNTDRDRLYVTHYARAAISELVLSSLAYTRTIDLVQAGYTDIPASVTAMTLGETSDLAYVILGPVDVARNFRALKLDLTTFEVLADGLVPGGTNYIYYSEANHSLWVADGAYASVLEIDAETLTLKATHAGPRFSMAFSPIGAHGTLAFGGPVDPDLAILCEASGEVVRRLPVGPKIMGVHYAPEMDALYVASGQGIFRVDATLLGCEP